MRRVRVVHSGESATRMPAGNLRQVHVLASSWPVRAGALACLALPLFAIPSGLAGQQFALDAEPIGASASLAWGSPGHRWGLGLGLVIPQFPQTLEPSGEDFEEYLHIAAFLRRGRGPIEVDAGVRVSVADLWECDASDCWPGVFGGAYVAAFAGWRHVKFGARVQAGRFQGSGEPGAFVVAVTPFLVRLSFGS